MTDFDLYARTDAEEAVLHKLPDLLAAFREALAPYSQIKRFGILTRVGVASGNLWVRVCLGDEPIWDGDFRIRDDGSVDVAGRAVQADELIEAVLAAAYLPIRNDFQTRLFLCSAS